jgi:hypothetical protein
MQYVLMRGMTARACVSDKPESRSLRQAVCCWFSISSRSCLRCSEGGSCCKSGICYFPTRYLDVVLLFVVFDAFGGFARGGNRVPYG